MRANGNPFIMEKRNVFQKQSTRLFMAALAGLLAIQTPGFGQATAAKTATPVDLTGYWVSVVTTLDWRFRMVLPPRGDYFGVRMSPAAVKIADAWDPAKDEAAGEQCKSFGAAGIMRVPGRLHITKPDDKTLRIDIDAGTQTRIFHFGDWKAPGGEPTWQGDSVASWDTSGSGGLKVVTTHMRPGYLRRNGVPYSANAVLTEYYDVVKEKSGEQRIVLTSSVDDPTYLAGPFAGSVHFKKQADGAGWDPSACSAKW